MIINGVSYDDENYVVARVPDARMAGEEHRSKHGHYGVAENGAFTCQDCSTVFYDDRAMLTELVKANVQIDERFVRKLIDLAVEFATDLTELTYFINRVCQAHGVNVEFDLYEQRDAIESGDEEP